MDGDTNPARDAKTRFVGALFPVPRKDAKLRRKRQNAALRSRERALLNPFASKEAKKHAPTTSP